MSNLVLREFRAFRKNSLRGFASVELPNGLTIKDISLHELNGKRWSSLPSKPVIKDGAPVFKDGKAQYVPILQWRSRDLSDGFSEAVVALIEDNHPDAF